MTPPVIAAPLQGRYAPRGLATATPSVPLTHPVFEPFHRKAGRK
jgi:hypothetical protein